MSEMNPQKLTNLVMILIALLGIGITAYGAYLYIDAEQGIDDNKFINAKEAGEPLPVNQLEVSRLGSEMFKSQQEYTELLNQRGEAPRYAGVGIAVIAVAWIGRDFISGRRKANGVQTADDTPQPQSTVT